MLRNAESITVAKSPFAARNANDGLSASSSPAKTGVVRAKSLDEMHGAALARYRYLHLRDHGEANNRMVLGSLLVLAQDQLPDTPMPRAGQPFVNSLLSAREVVGRRTSRYWNVTNHPVAAK